MRHLDAVIDDAIKLIPLRSFDPLVEQHGTDRHSNNLLTDLLRAAVRLIALMSADPAMEKASLRPNPGPMGVTATS